MPTESHSIKVATNVLELTDDELAYITAAVGALKEPSNPRLYAKLYNEVFKAKGTTALVKLNEYEISMCKVNRP